MAEESSDNVRPSVVLYPPGGAFNKLRAEQSFLEEIMENNVIGYTDAVDKRLYIKMNILEKIPEGLRIFKGTSPSTGCMTFPTDEELYVRLGQKMRDLKKKWKRNPAPPWMKAPVKNAKGNTPKKTPCTPKKKKKPVKVAQSEGTLSAREEDEWSLMPRQQSGAADIDLHEQTPWIPDEIVTHIEGTDSTKVELLLSTKNQLEWYKYNCEKLMRTIEVQREIIQHLELALGKANV